MVRDPEIQIAYIVALVVVFLLCPVAARGSCAVPGSVCSALTEAELVFVGDVTAVERQSGPADVALMNVRFRIIERFKGGTGSTQSLAIAPSSEESVQYREGQRILVYTRRYRNAWFTACTRTREVKLDDAELGELRVLGQQRGPVVVGDVRRLNGSPAGHVRVVVRLGSSIVATSVTDAAGRYEIAWLTPGRYTVAVDGPSGRGRKGTQILVTGDTRCLIAGTIQIQ